MEYNIIMIKQMLFLFNFEDIFVLIFLNISNIEVEEDLDIDELKNFNVSI